MTTNDKISLDEAARRMHSTPLNVLMHIKRGLLPGEETGDGWLVDAAALEDYLGKRADAAPGSVCEQNSCAHKCSSCG